MFDLLNPNEWDALRNWIGTVGGVIALLIAASTYRHNVKLKQEAQARLVYSKITHADFHERGTYFDLLPNDARLSNGCTAAGIVMDPDDPHHGMGIAFAPLIRVTAIVHNGSKELIGPARIQLVNRGRNCTWDEFSISLAVIDPESDYVVVLTWVNFDHPGEPSLGTTVIFRDASAQWWRRHLAEPIERVHDDPENSGPTPAERIGIRAHQALMGFESIAEPEISLRVRWHRFRRKMRGKPPIP